MEADVQVGAVGSDTHVQPPEALDEIRTRPGAISEETDSDATQWLLSSDGPTEEEVEPTMLRVNVGTPSAPRIIEWFVVPLPGIEFKRFQKMAMGNRQNRRQIAQGDVTLIDDAKFHRLVVTAATVKPDLAAVAASKGLGDPSLVLEHRFRHKPGIIAQISGAVSDISGNDPDDVEVVAGNS